MEYSLGQALVASALAVFLYVLFLYVLALIRRNYSLIDKGWGFGIWIAAMVPVLLQNQVQTRQLVIVVLVTTWALRLGTHIFIRSWGRGEDRRYASWRERWGEYGWFVAFFQIFLLQGLLMWLVALPAMFVNALPGPNWRVLDFVALFVWLGGFAWESIADYQLEEFRHHAANKGRILMTGLWRYSRHPNYFGEMVQWWGIWLFALSVPGSWFNVLGPLIVMFLLLKVSGVPALEEHMRQNPEFREYARMTPSIIPKLSK